MKIIEVKKFRKKPVVVEAVQWNGSRENYDYIVVWSGHIAYRETRNVLKIDTLEGIMEAKIDDWIIKGISGEFYPVKPDIFQKTYEEVTK